MLKRIILMLGVVMAGQAGAEATHKGYEMPPYTVEWQDTPREIRAFGPHLPAEVKVSGSRSGAIRFVQADASRQLVDRFSGLPGTDSVAGRAKALRTWATALGFKITARPH